MDKKMREAVLSIFYTDQYKKLHREPQGKIFYQNGRPVYLADMTPTKWWKNYGGYSIARQILEAFSQVKIRPQIIYRRKDLGTLYITNLTAFKKKGVLVAYGSHQQYALPIGHWKAIIIGFNNEPKDLPVMAVDDWIKSASILPAQKPIVEDFTIPLGVKMRLGEEFRRKYA